MTTDTNAWTVRRVLSWAMQDFQDKGFDSPRLDAELLLGRALDLTRVQLILQAERPLAEAELREVRGLIQRRRKAEPIAYILGEREFYGYAFKVDARVLIPRPDTETLVQVALRETTQSSEFGVALDLCTGSGCVAIAFAKQRPTWKVTASDLSEDALTLARENAERLGAAWGMRFLRSDLFEALDPRVRFTLIMANPPYIPEPDIAQLQPDVRDYEPRIALAGGPSGLEVIERLVSTAPRHLANEGVLAVEIGSDQAEQVTRRFEAAGFRNVQRDADYAGHHRVVSGVWSP